MACGVSRRISNDKAPEYLGIQRVGVRSHAGFIITNPIPRSRRNLQIGKLTRYRECVSMFDSGESSSLMDVFYPSFLDP